MAELIAAYSPPMPNPVRNRNRKNHQPDDDHPVPADQGSRSRRAGTLVVTVPV
jgi:hypothetical protein